MSTARSIYRVLRSIVFTAVLVVVALIVSLYVALSIPAVQNNLRLRAEHELTQLFKAPVSIGKVDIFPFNEVRLHEVSMYTPAGKRCISIGRLGAGIDLWTLITDRDIKITYAEIISMNASVEQSAEGAPLNIQFIIDAFKSEEKKEPSKFKVVLHNVVIRNSNLTFNRTYKPLPENPEQMDFNHIELYDLNADVEAPLIANDDFMVNLRRLAFIERSGLEVRGLSLEAHVTPTEISMSDFRLKVGSSDISLSDQTLKIKGYNDIVDVLLHEDRTVGLAASPFYPADFAPLVPQLATFKSQFSLKLGVSGRPDNFRINDLVLREHSGQCNLDLNAEVAGLTDPKTLRASVSKLEAKVSSEYSEQFLHLASAVPEKVAGIVGALGDISLKTSGRLDMAASSAEAVVDLVSSAGDLAAKAGIDWPGGMLAISDFAAKTESFALGQILGVDDLGLIALEADGDVRLRGKEIEGNVTAVIPFVDYKGNRFQNIAFDASKQGDNVSGHVEVDDRYAVVNVDADCVLAGNASSWNLTAGIDHLTPGVFGVKGFAPDYRLSGQLTAAVTGDSPSNFAGNVNLSNFDIVTTRNFHLDHLDVQADIDGDLRSYLINSEYLTAHVAGSFDPIDMVAMTRNLLAEAVPAIIRPGAVRDTEGQYADFTMTIPASDELFSLVKTPVKPGVPVEITGKFEGSSRHVALNVDAPYLIQGKNKLIKGTELAVELRDSVPANVVIRTNMPMKNDRANAMITVNADNNLVDTQLRWRMDGNYENVGKVQVATEISRAPLTGKLALSARFRESGFQLNGADWTVSPAEIDYSAKSLEVRNLRIAHAAQFVDINGRASDSPMDIITANLAGIDLEYIFNILNINHVDFGGIATGKAYVTNLFSGSPVAQTDGFFVKNLAYNGAVLGDTQIESHWDNSEGLVAINADITGTENSWATVRGGVYVTRDSLSFDFNADHLDVAFLKPFVSGFTSDIQGRASGNIKLYGTFSDIDLAGRAFADTVTMKVDYTNCFYSGSDSIIFTPGRISIPKFRLYDKYGNSCLLTGVVTHNCLHDPAFNFDVTDVRHMLAYDTNAKLNPAWYGHIFTTGNAKLVGRPGIVTLDVNMSTDPGSEFTLVLEETQTAVDYTFLTFSDKRKELEIEQNRTVTFEDLFAKSIEKDMRERPDIFAMNLAVDVNPGANVIIVMDPAAGDKIKAQGNGALQMHYSSDSDDMTLYGKYTLERGTYNFSLQDLILKNFNIERGSSISFNGDPLNGLLDITASYRVNTNLADLDLSFKNDPDLNRTSVPVDALLKVTGDIHSPEINFDLRLPTVTAEVERKMRSIVSTEDMMNRQVIYLLALNRFYTPEYTGGEQGGELASVASSTLSSQIQNILGSLTDKLSVSPTIKSEKSDLSDMEFDVALSSSLFDNRLLLNGNLGYRDKSTSQTTFVGDFDLEYLLSRDGRLRLKAYNHFNDASYYLKSALTTQGIGVIYRKDFDDPFTFLKRIFRRKRKNDPEVVDSKDKNKKTKDSEDN